MDNKALVIENMSVRFGEQVVFGDFSLTIAPNTITCILGPSGSGKTTLLKSLAGLLPEATNVTEVPCSYIFQEPRLIPSMTALDNVAVVLPGKLKDNREYAAKFLEDMELTDAVGKYPHELSGGMAQRVAIARGLIYDAPVLLMDEPFKGLDLPLQERLVKYFIKYWQKNKKTCLFVTHSILDALLVADRVIVLKQGEQGAEIAYDRTIDLPREGRALGEANVDAIRSEIHDLLVSL